MFRGVMKCRGVYGDVKEGHGVSMGVIKCC